MMAASGDNTTTSQSSDPGPFLGQVFPTFENLESFLRDYGRRTNTLFVKDNCRKLKFDKRVYEYATLVCKQGGRRQKSVSKGVRANLSTTKCGCPVLVKVASQKCQTSGQFVYRLTKVILEHNHDVSESKFKAYPENRRPILTEDVQSLLDCSSVSNLDVRLHVQQTQGKKLLHNDVKNMRLRHSQSQQADITKVQQFIHSLNESGGVVMSVKHDAKMKMAVQKKITRKVEQENRKLKSRIDRLERENAMLKKKIRDSQTGSIGAANTSQSSCKRESDKTSKSEAIEMQDFGGKT